MESFRVSPTSFIPGDQLRSETIPDNNFDHLMKSSTFMYIIGSEKWYMNYLLLIKEECVECDAQVHFHVRKNGSGMQRSLSDSSAG